MPAQTKASHCLGLDLPLNCVCMCACVCVCECVCVWGGGDTQKTTSLTTSSKWKIKLNPRHRYTAEIPDLGRIKNSLVGTDLAPWLAWCQSAPGFPSQRTSSCRENSAGPDWRYHRLVNSETKFKPFNTHRQTQKTQAHTHTHYIYIWWENWQSVLIWMEILW